MSEGRRLRLLKVIVQPVFVIDDGEMLTEHVAQPMTVSAGDWRDYATGPFLASFEALRQQVEGPPSAHADGNGE